jgi:RNA polymerase I-specific transcription initiation factor RRN7
MRQPERCEECSTRLWYEQEGLRYCKNGHQLEGFASHDAGEDGYGTKGRVSRVRKEKRQKAAVKLEGAEGRKLYLEVLQLVLMKQAWWLVKQKGFPDTLEAVTKGIWGYRLSMCDDDDAEETENEKDLASSGQSATEDSDAATGIASAQATVGVRRRIPRLIDTLALCYLGCNVLRLPVSTADLHEWAMKGDIEFLAAVCIRTLVV